MTERELFENKFNHLDLDYVDDLGYCESETQTAWEAWQASASREGYKLVPKSFIVDIHDMALDGECLRETDQSQEKFTEIRELCKEVMMGDVE